jgi:hypothetical protein
MTEKSKVIVKTEKQATQDPPAAGFNPYEIISLSLRVTNTLYNQVKQETENRGFSSLAEYFKEAAREKLTNDAAKDAETALKYKQARGF